jgi:hypothetical protein
LKYVFFAFCRTFPEEQVTKDRFDGPWRGTPRGPVGFFATLVAQFRALIAAGTRYSRQRF